MVIANLSGYGMPVALAKAVVALFAASLDPRNGEVSMDVETVTGRPAGSFGAWAERHAATFN